MKKSAKTPSNDLYEGANYLYQVLFNAGRLLFLFVYVGFFLSFSIGLLWLFVSGGFKH